MSQQVVETLNSALERDDQESLSLVGRLPPFLYGLDALLDNGLKVRFESEEPGKITSRCALLALQQSGRPSIQVGANHLGVELDGLVEIAYCAVQVP